MAISRVTTWAAGNVLTAAALNAEFDNLLNQANTAPTSYTIGDLLQANSGTTLTTLAAVAAGSYLRSGGVATASVWSTVTLPNTTTISQLLYSSAANVVAGLATANSGILITSSGGVPSIGTDIPTAVTIGAAYVYRVGGTDVAVADGGTGVGTFTANGILYGNSATSILVTAQGGTNTILTASAGAPVFSATPIINTSVQLGVVSTATGSLKLAHASSANLTTITAGNATAAVTYVWPTADGTSGQVLSTNASGALSWATASAGAVSVKVGTFTRDLTTASGTQAVTGVGFTPKAIIFLTASSAVDVGYGSWGVTDGGVVSGIEWRGGVTADTFAASNIISVILTATDYQYVSAISLDADGFTVTWVKAGSPTGTAAIRYLAIR